MDHIYTMERANQLVALEAFTLPNLGIKELVSKVLPNIVNAFSGFIGTFNPSDKPIPLTIDQKKLIEFLSKQKYMDLAPLTIDCPEGLDVSYLEYAIELKAAVDHSQSVHELLNKFTTFIAMLIGNADVQLTSKTNMPEYLAFQDKREQLTRRMAACFKNGSRKSEARYGDLIKRNAEWELVINYSNTMADDMNKVDRKQLNKKVHELGELLEKIISMHKRGMLDNISPDVITEISNGTLQIAKELEFFSVIYYRVLAFANTTNSSAKYTMEVLTETRK